MARWPVSCGVTTVSDGIHRGVLDSSIRCSGATWSQTLSAFRPDGEVSAVRALMRHRSDLVQTAAQHIQHMQKSLTQMNLQIHHVMATGGADWLWRRAAALNGWHEPCDGRLSCTVL